MEEDVCAEHEDYPYIRASFDGYSPQVGLEIKCPGKTQHTKNLKTKKVPDIYYAQIQQQLLVGGMERIDFVSYSGEDEGDNLIIPEYQDPIYQQQLLTALTTVWNYIQTGTLPPATPKDRAYLQARLLKSAKESNELALALVLITEDVTEKQ
jgi:predicted phage-related endonuclease